MTKALIYKELRESCLIALGALALYLFVVGRAVGLRMLPWEGADRGVIPFVGGSFSFSYACICAGFAVVLGFRQTVGEAIHGTWQFLLHRPLPRRRQIVLKLLVGAALYLTVGAIPILLYAWWAATPGTHASPFLWSMTEPAWRIWLVTVLVYLGAFTSGLRPARWLGSRLWPLAASGSVVLIVSVIPFWPSAAAWLGILLLAGALLMANIATVTGLRDYP